MQAQQLTEKWMFLTKFLESPKSVGMHRTVWKPLRYCVELGTHSDNKRAIRNYEKAGFVIEGVLRQAMYTINGHRDHVVMGLLRDEWEARVQLPPKYV